MTKKKTKPRAGALIGLDVGTSGARAVALDLAGNVLATATEEYPLSTPRPGWTEQDAERWWAASRHVLSRVAAELPDPPLGLGLTGQMHGSVFLDSSDRVIRPALLWSDQRTANQCRAITEKVGAERLVEITGNPAITGFQAPKILWLRENEPDAYARVRHVLLPKDYVRLRLTGEFATDASDASGTLLLDLRRRNWSDEVLAALEIPRSWLPDVHEGPDVTGRITATAAAGTALPAGLVVAAGGGDNAASAVGNGIVRDGLVSSSIGTSGVVFAASATIRIDPAGRLHAFCHAVPGHYHLMGVTLSAGGSLRWWRDTGAGGKDYEAMSMLAAQAPPGSEGLVFLPYLTGERTPYLDPEARGAFIGLNVRHTQAHLTRAVMEGVTYSLKDCLDLMTELGLTAKEVRATGGGARSPFWRQLQADVFGLPIHRTSAEEGPAFGAALLAGVAAGAYSDVGAACAVIRMNPDVHTPDPGRNGIYRRYLVAYRDLYAATAPVMHRLAALGSENPGN
ncbi:MAG TPA: xylulokinase [Candidatus Dormibacteraeota bacterium]|nr:xylulokinase [Candidatus Dormibacteraeota bacterium]